MLRNIVRKLRGDDTVWKKLNLRLDNFDLQLKLISQSEENLVEYFCNNDLFKSLNTLATKLDLLGNQIGELKVNQNETFKRLDYIINELHLIHEVKAELDKQNLELKLVRDSSSNIAKELQHINDIQVSISNQQRNQQLVLERMQEISDRVLQQKNIQESAAPQFTNIINEIKQVQKMCDLVEEHQADLSLCFLKIVEGLEKFNERLKKNGFLFEK